MFRFLCILPRCFPQKNRKDCHLSATFVEKYRCAQTCETTRCKAENDNKKGGSPAIDYKLLNIIPPMPPPATPMPRSAR